MNKSIKKYIYFEMLQDYLLFLYPDVKFEQSIIRDVLKIEEKFLMKGKDII